MASPAPAGRGAAERADQLREQDVKEWLEQLLGQRLGEEGGGGGESSNSWLEELQSGVLLCRALGAISPELAVKHQKRPTGVWAKRDNLSVFLDRIKDPPLQMPSAVLFEIADLLPSDGAEWRPRNVVTCLYHLTRVAHERFGVQPPGMVRAEMEIDQEKEPDAAAITAAAAAAEQRDEKGDEDDQPGSDSEPEGAGAPAEATGGADGAAAADSSAPPAARAPSPPEAPPAAPPEAPPEAPRPTSTVRKYRAVKGDDVDQKVRQEVNRFARWALRSREAVHEAPSLVRLKYGQYLVLPMRKVVYMRVLRGFLMVRVGGGWKSFDEFMRHSTQFQASRTMQRSSGSFSHLLQRGSVAQSAADVAGPPERRESGPRAAQQAVPRGSGASAAALERRASGAAAGAQGRKDSGSAAPGSDQAAAPAQQVARRESAASVAARTAAAQAVAARRDSGRAAPPAQQSPAAASRDPPAATERRVSGPQQGRRRSTNPGAARKAPPAGTAAGGGAAAARAVHQQRRSGPLAQTPSPPPRPAP